MPHYGWSGPGELREIGFDRARPPEFIEPSSPDSLAGGPETKTQLFQCAVEGCGRKFRKAMIAARHFNGSHMAFREDGDSWRTYVKEIWE